MSDSILKLIPKDPKYITKREVLEKAKDKLASFVPRADEVSIKIRNDIVFVDPGLNFNKISCPKCLTNITDWWSKDGMGVANGDHFESLIVTMPCCKSELSLNELIYDWPAGFSRFSLEARNPQIKDLSEDQIHIIEKYLDSPLIKIWARY